MIEILENGVSPQTKPFVVLNLPSGSQSKLNARDIDGLRGEFDPPLSPYASITVVEPGVRWTIDEPSYTYTINAKNPETANAVARVDTRSRKTTGTR